jgi:hypothetical protein
MSSSDRKPYLNFTVFNQDLLNDCHDNLTNQLELVVEIEADSGTIYASDRNKYVGDVFYEALLKFPTVKRTIGEWLSPTLEFSTVNLELSNVDGRFNELLPGGSNFAGWIQRSVVIKVGLRDVASTYATIFDGRITEVAGVNRTTKSVRILARDNFDKINVAFPIYAFGDVEFPDINPSLEGKLKPVIYGDWTVNVNPDTGASVPGIVVNSEDPAVVGGTTNVQCYVSENTNTFFDNTTVTLVRSGEVTVFSATDIVNVHANKNYFEIAQPAVTLLPDGSAYVYKKGDKIYCQVKGKAISGGYDDNIVAQAKDILIYHGGLLGGDFDANWDTYRDKATPAESAISTFKSRAYINKQEKAMTYALSLLEQVRLEAYQDRNQKIKINSLHFEDMEAVPSYVVRNVDVEKNTFRPKIDARNNFNRCQGFYNRLPDLDDNANTTAFYRNNNSIVLASGKVISKGIVFPNLYEAGAVADQTQAILKLASSYFEIIDMTLTWRSLLLDLGDFVAIDVKIGSTIFESVPAMVRDIGYDPNGIKLPVKLWSFQMTPFPGYEPGYSGTVGGYNAIITEE